MNFKKNITIAGIGLLLYFSIIITRVYRDVAIDFGNTYDDLSISLSRISIWMSTIGFYIFIVFICISLISLFKNK